MRTRHTRMFSPPAQTVPDGAADGELVQIEPGVWMHRRAVPTWRAATAIERARHARLESARP